MNDVKKRNRMISYIQGNLWAWILLAAIIVSLGTKSEWKFVFSAGRYGARHAIERKNAGNFFPKGCVWRDIPKENDMDSWGVRRYEYFDEHTEEWSMQQPNACRLDLKSSKVWRRHAILGQDDRQEIENPSSEIQCDNNYCIFKNLWYNDGHWYILAESKENTSSIQNTPDSSKVHDDNNGFTSVIASKDVEMFKLSVRNSSLFKDQVEALWIPGQTIVIDFLFFLHPTAIGHWLEHLMPLVSINRMENIKLPARIIILHLKRFHIFEWVRAAIGSALGLIQESFLPPILLQEEVGSVEQQFGARLEGVESNEWLCFESVLIAKDTHTDGDRVAMSNTDARQFRSNAYKLHGLYEPKHIIEQIEEKRFGSKNKTACEITLLRKSANRRIVNEIDLVDMLKSFGNVTVIEFTSATPMMEQLKLMSKTCLLVSAHTSGLANAVFLPPGAAVMELIQRNWVWPNLDLSFKVQTQSLGDVHHWAWRARFSHEIEYLDQRDKERFGGEEWSGEKCDTNECSEVHTNVDLIVDVDAVRTIISKQLPLVLQGKPPQEITLSWPSVD